MIDCTICNSDEKIQLVSFQYSTGWKNQTESGTLAGRKPIMQSKLQQYSACMEQTFLLQLSIVHDFIACTVVEMVNTRLARTLSCKSRG